MRHGFVQSKQTAQCWASCLDLGGSKMREFPWEPNILASSLWGGNTLVPSFSSQLTTKMIFLNLFKTVHMGISGRRPLMLSFVAQSKSQNWSRCYRTAPLMSPVPVPQGPSSSSSNTAPHTYHKDFSLAFPSAQNDPSSLRYQHSSPPHFLH